MYRLRLMRGVGNEFYIDQSYVNRKYIRIMKVELNEKILPSESYLMKGPRAIKILEKLNIDDKVYAYVMNAELGNRYFPALKR